MNQYKVRRLASNSSVLAVPLSMAAYIPEDALFTPEFTEEGILIG